MSLRKLTSLTAFFSFLFVLLTSSILYITPQGRIAYWADWTLLGLSKDQWGAIHINAGAIFLLAMFLHIFYNWRPIVNYLKSKKQGFSSLEGIVSIILVALCFIGTLAEIPPFSSIMQLNDNIKVKAAQKYGEPPYGHAELSSLTSFAKKRNQNVDDIVTALEKADFHVASAQNSLKEIAAANKVSPQTIYLAFPPQPKAPATDDSLPAMPLSPAPGTGNKTIGELAAEFNFPGASIFDALGGSGMKLEMGMTIKEIAASNGMSPIDVYDRVRDEAAKIKE